LESSLADAHRVTSTWCGDSISPNDLSDDYPQQYKDYAEVREKISHYHTVLLVLEMQYHYLMDCRTQVFLGIDKNGKFRWRRGTMAKIMLFFSREVEIALQPKGSF